MQNQPGRLKEAKNLATGLQMRTSCAGGFLRPGSSSSAITRMSLFRQAMLESMSMQRTCSSDFEWRGWYETRRLQNAQRSCLADQCKGCPGPPYNLPVSQSWWPSCQTRMQIIIPYVQVLIMWRLLSWPTITTLTTPCTKQHTVSSSSEHHTAA